MIIEQVREQMQEAAKPVVKILKQGDSYKVITIGLKKDVVLKEHKTAVPATLVILEGKVLYNEAERSVQLNKDTDFEIPVNVPHGLLAVEDSICLLIQG
jgi:quercetin dioxygenase-like cupin family protein